jgi:excisionase family DNA binding protein
MMTKSQSPNATGAKHPRVLGSKWDEYETFTVKEVGQILRLGRNQAYAAAASGEIPTIRFGRKLVVPRLALEKMLSVA